MSHLILCVAWYYYYDMSSVTVFPALSFEKVHYSKFWLIIHSISSMVARDVKLLFNGMNLFRSIIDCFIRWFFFLLRRIMRFHSPTHHNSSIIKIAFSIFSIIPWGVERQKKIWLLFLFWYINTFQIITIKTFFDFCGCKIYCGISL